MSSFLEGKLSDELIRNYRDDLDFQNLIDLVQQVRKKFAQLMSIHRLITLCFHRTSSAVAFPQKVLGKRYIKGTEHYREP